MNGVPKELTQFVRTVTNLVSADEGVVYLVEADPTSLTLHFAGKFSGCPGNQLVLDTILEPLRQEVCPSVKLRVTSGALIPSGAARLEPSDVE